MYNFTNVNEKKAAQSSCGNTYILSYSNVEDLFAAESIANVEENVS